MRTGFGTLPEEEEMEPTTNDNKKRSTRKGRSRGRTPPPQGPPILRPLNASKRSYPNRIWGFNDLRGQEWDGKGKILGHFKRESWDFLDGKPRSSRGRALGSEEGSPDPLQ